MEYSLTIHIVSSDTKFLSKILDYIIWAKLSWRAVYDGYQVTVYNGNELNLLAMELQRLDG